MFVDGKPPSNLSRTVPAEDGAKIDAASTAMGSRR